MKNLLKTAILAAAAAKVWPRIERGIDEGCSWAKRKLDQVTR